MHIFRWQEGKKPALKGVFHAFTFIYYILISPLLYQKVPEPLSIPIGFYLLSVVLNFGSSAFYHLIKWPTQFEIYPKRLDHVMIFVKILSTYFAIINTVISEVSSFIIWWLIISGGSGILIRIFFTRAPKPIIALPYILVAWSAILEPIILIELKQKLPTGFLILFFGGISYTTGAIFYMLKYPKIWIKWLGPHEIFHLFTVIGSACLTCFIFDFAIPYWLEINGDLS